MTKYLVFRNEIDSGLSNEFGTCEAIACEISIAIGMDRFPREGVVAFPAESPQALMCTLKELPRASLVLDDVRMALWTNEASQIHDALTSYEDAIDNACSSLGDTANELESVCEGSETFSEFFPDVNLDRAFDYLASPDVDGFSEKLAEIFEFEILNR
jgi:hypothetical protein